MKKALWRISLSLALMLGMLAFAGAATNAVEVGEKATDFTATLLDDSKFTLSDHLGQVVFVNVWASWCGPCASEVADLQQMAEDYPDTLVILGINCGEDEQTIRDFVKQENLTYLHAADVQYALIDSVFPTQYIPYTVVIDPTGVVIYADSGSESYDTFKSLYEEAMAGSRVTDTLIESQKATADLYATEITYSADSIHVGDTVYFDSGIGNGGTADTGVFNIKWFINNVRQGYGSHDGVAAGKIVMNGNSQFWWTPEKAGSYTISFEVDADHFYDDSNPDNNTTEIEVTANP